MTTFKIPTSNFSPHPSGTFEGQIVAVEDKGQVETQFGLKPKVAIVIESETELMEGGRPYTASLWVTLSSSNKSKLYKTRASLLGRDLTPDERASFQDTELIGMRVGYQVVHREGREGGIFANVDQVWPLKQNQATSEPGREKEEELLIL